MKKIKDMTLEEMLEEFRDIKVELAFPLERKDTLEKAIKAHVRETGEVATVDGANIKVIHVKAGRRAKTKELLVDALSDPNLASKYVRESPASVRVKIEVD